MGVDLTLLPVESWREGTHAQTGKPYVWGFSHSMLQLGRQRLCWEAIEALKPEKLPEGHDISAFVAKRPDGERGYGQLVKDPYGGEYTWVEAGRLAEVLEKFPPQAPAAAYLSKLPPETKIILHWH